MALEPKQKIYVKTRQNFDSLLTAGTIGNNHLVFIEDTQEVWTHGTFFSGRSFKSVSDGNNIASSPSTSGIITFNGSGKVSVEVGNDGVTVTGANASVETGDADGQVKIDGQNVSVKGLGSAAYTSSSDYTAASHASDTNNPHGVTAAQVGLGNVTNESKATMFTDAALTGTPTAPTASAGDNSTQIATTAYVDAAVAALLGASDAMIFKGTLGATTGSVEALPESHKAGDTYKVADAGTYAGQVCEVGDLVICITKGTTANDSHWAVVQTNIDGAVTGPASAVADHIATFSGATGKIIADSGYTIATSVPAGAVFTDDSVTSASNHYTPTKDDSATKTAAGATGTSGSAVQVITAIETDGKGHITGIVSGEATDTTYTASDGVALSNGNFTNSGVRSITSDNSSETNANGTINVNTNGTETAVAVKGLGSAAFTDSSAYATAAQGTKADNAVPQTTTVNSKALSGDIVLDATDVALTDAYAKASSASAVAGSDTIQAAIGKLEYKLDTAISDAGWAEYN